MNQALAVVHLAHLIIANPGNDSVLGEAAKGKCGPAVGYLVPGLDPLYPATLFLHPAKYGAGRWVYHVDLSGQLFLPSSQPRVLVAVPTTPHLSSEGGWHAL